MTRRTFLKSAAATAALSATPLSSVFAQGATIKVGILHSLSGTMAISETALKETALMTIDEINAKRRRDGQAARAGGGRPGVELAAVRREGAPADHAGQGCRGLRLLDLGVAQVGAAGVQGTEQPALLPGAVRGRGTREERLLHRRRAQPAGDPGSRVPDEQGRRRRQALRPARHRLRLSAHHQQDPARVPEEQGRRREGHRGGLHAVRPQRLPDHRRQHQEVRRPAARPRWSRPSTATPTCRSTRNSATPA